MKKYIVYALCALLIPLGIVAAAYATPPTGGPPGQGECNHGNSGKECKPDPQPEHGKDCDNHGNHGGVNEDHCLGDTTTTPTTPTDTTPTDTTPTTPTDTTPTTPTDTTPATTTTVTVPPVSVPTVSTVTPPPVVATTPKAKKKAKKTLTHKPVKPKVKKVKIVKVQKTNQKGVVKITTSDGKTHTGIMGSG